jgi:hypothetical protein
LGKLRKRSILSIWLGHLTAEKAAVYEPSVRDLETGYSLMSVALDEGLRLSETGELWAARKSAELCGELAERHAGLLCGALGTMERRSRHFGTLPEVQPLDAENFRGEGARKASKWNALLHKVLFSARARWFHKLLTLEEILWEVRQTFVETAEKLADGLSVAPARDWSTLEQAHDDWNTCLRECTILLKCLLATLAPGEVEELRRELEEQRQGAEARSSDWLKKRKRTARAVRREGTARA